MPASRSHLWLPLLCFVAGIFWVLGSDLLLGHLLQGRSISGFVVSLKGALFVALCALLLFLVMRRNARRLQAVVPRLEPLVRRGILRPVMIFLVAAVGVALASTVVYMQQSDQIRREGAEDLISVGELKAEQIDQWLLDRETAIGHSGRNHLLAHSLMDTAPSHAAVSSLTRRAMLDSILLSDDFQSVTLYARDGHPVDATGAAAPMTEQQRRLAQGALVSGRVVVSDLYVPAGSRDGQPVLDLVVAVSDPEAPGDHSLGVLVARTSATKFLYPLVASWPTSELTGEGVLFRREGERAVYLTPSKLALRQPFRDAVPMSRDDLAIVRIINGERGPFEALDDRGQPVLAVGRPIRNTSWYLVAKVDLDELYSPQRRLLLLAVALGLAALTASAALIALWWRGERFALSTRLQDAEQRATALKEHFELAGRYANEAVLLCDDHGRILEVNDRAEELYGFTRAELQAMSLEDLRPHDTAEARLARQQFRALLDTGIAETFESRIWPKDGTSFPVQVKWRLLQVQGRTFVQGIVSDISERLAQDKRIAEIAAERDRVLARLQLQFDRMPVGCVVTPRNGGDLQVNPAFERIFGYCQDELRGADLLALIVPAEYRVMLEQRLAPLEHSDQPVTLVHENLTRAGRRITCRWSNTPLRDADGRLTAVMAMCEDITERVIAERALRSSEERYRLLAEVSPVGIYRADLAGNVVYVNSRLCEIAGRPPQQCLGMAWAAVLHPDDLERLAAFNEEYLASEGRASRPQEFRLVRPDGTVVWVLSQASPERGPDGEVLSHIGTVTDVTALKQVQEELQEARDHLEERVAARTRELEIARDEAERADRVKTAFLSTVSHELRTPLNSILGFTDVVLQGLSGPLNEPQQRQLTIVRDSAVHLRALIEDVLDISRVEAGQMSLEIGPVDLGDLLQRRVASFEPEAARRGLSLSAIVPADLGTVRSDPRRLGQILNNLLSNAVKFTTRGSVQLVARREADVIVVEIRDTGPGIAAADLDKLFRPFSQVTRPGGRVQEGTGLGLAISRQLAQALGGNIEVVSEPGRGSVFSLVLPPAAADRKLASTTGIFRRPAVA